MKTHSNSCGCEAGLIDVTGLCIPANTTEVISVTPYWKQMHISESLQIPDQKPDVEQINSVDVSVNILRAEVIKTPRSYDDTGATPVAQPNLEGRLLSGRKLIIEGQLCQKIVYTALESTQPLHSDVNACVEDVTASVLDQRNILKQVTLMLYAVPTRATC